MLFYGELSFESVYTTPAYTQRNCVFGGDSRIKFIKFTIGSRTFCIRSNFFSDMVGIDVLYMQEKCKVYRVVET